MAFENIDQLIFQLSLLRTEPEVETFRRANTAAITALLHKHFGEDNINHRAISKLFRDNGYPIDRMTAVNMSQAAREEKNTRTRAAYDLKRKRNLQQAL